MGLEEVEVEVVLVEEFEEKPCKIEGELMLVEEGEVEEQSDDKANKDVLEIERLLEIGGSVIHEGSGEEEEEETKVEVQGLENLFEEITGRMGVDLTKDWLVGVENGHTSVNE